VCGALSSSENVEVKKLLDRIVAMLTRLGRRAYSVREEPEKYVMDRVDSDSDTEPDPEKNEETL
jgi:hypothetical protein